MEGTVDIMPTALFHYWFVMTIFRTQPTLGYWLPVHAHCSGTIVSANAKLRADHSKLIDSLPAC